MLLSVRVICHRRAHHATDSTTAVFRRWHVPNNQASFVAFRFEKVESEVYSCLENMFNEDEERGLSVDRGGGGSGSGGSGGDSSAAVAAKAKEATGDSDSEFDIDGGGGSASTSAGKVCCCMACLHGVSS